MLTTWRAADFLRIENLIDRLGMLTRCEDCEVEDLYYATFRDKKIIGGKIQWVLPTKIGHVETFVDISEKLIKQSFAAVLD